MQAARGLGVLAFAAALVAGCGGDDDGGGGTATSDWANGVCEAVSSWSESIRATGDSLRESATSPDALKDAVDEFASATQTFVDDLRDLGAPDTEAGEEAK